MYVQGLKSMASGFRERKQKERTPAFCTAAGDAMPPSTMARTPTWAYTPQDSHEYLFLVLCCVQASALSPSVQASALCRAAFSRHMACIHNHRPQT